MSPVLLFIVNDPGFFLSHRLPVAIGAQAAGYRVGLALLLGLMLFATRNDLQQMRVFKILGGVFS